ncbi:hypothetical protein EG850_12235 [Gulosibacter macacae]|uniref:Uncharacterized protein n=1 Tax=Gulosibacter macacae TaxID=2488791 RepID=A0A3P3VTA7_9MICO|nr:hypothetical protein [Gulosibacter macacae]RRJ85684.1 hypothetical protein EG850_12235 [Gulosibacter macacae]
MTNVAQHPSPDLAALMLRDIGAELARRVSNRLPGLGDAYERRVVLVADAETASGTALGSFTSPAWRIQGRSFDKIAVALAHPLYRLPDGTIDAERVLATLAHEIAHLYTDEIGISGTIAPDHIGHTEDFALVAIRLGLSILRRPNTPTRIFTPGLADYGRAEFRDLIYRIACAGLHTASGIQLAGPVGFTGRLAPARVAAASIPTDPSTSD